MRHLTGRPTAKPQIKRRRRSDEDTGRAFRMAARNILGHAATWPVIGPAAAFLWNTLDWLNPYWSFDQDELHQDHLHPDPHDLSPRL